MTDVKATRPFGIFILAIIVLWIASWNGLRLGEAVFFWNTLRVYGASPLYIAISAGVWLIIGILLAWSLWQRKAWGRIALICASAGYSAWYWFDRLVLQEPRANWRFVLAVNIIILLLIITILFSRRIKGFYKQGTNGR
jgi:hypothetical protein